MPKVKLKDVVMRVKEKVDKDNTDLEYYVGGEHIDGNEICVSRRGVIQGSTIGPAFHMAFKAGDVLLMSRNPHLRKASMVDFDGICSDVSYICRTKDESVLLQSFLPFLMQTNDFWRFAEENKKGGLPFFLNWSDFERYEFELPPIEKQRELSQLLWAMQRTKQAYQNLLAKSDELVKSQFIELFGDPIDNPFGWETTGLLAIGDCKNGMNFGANEQGVNLRCVGVGDVKDRSRIDNLGELTLLSLNQMPAKEYLLQDGDIVFVRSNGNKNLVGRCVSVYPQDNPLTFSGFCIRFRKNTNRVLISYLLQLFKQQSVREKLVGRGANIQNLNQKMLAALEIPVPPLHLQEKYKAFVEQLDKSKFELRQGIANINNLMNSLMQQDFSN